MKAPYNWHVSVQHAPAILESFKKDQGNVPSNCATALGNMFYEPALEVMFEYFSSVKSAETFLGILDYFGKIDNENCPEIYYYANAGHTHSGIGSSKFIIPSLS
jgi:hypothetical protein